MNSETLAVFHPPADKDYQKPAARSIHELLVRGGQSGPGRPAIAAPGRAVLTYQNLLNLADSAANQLARYGLKRNDRVAIVLPNGPEMATAFLSVGSVATCAPLNPSYKADEFDFYLSDLNAKALIIGAGMNSDAIKVAHKHAIPTIELKWMPDQPAGTFELSGGNPAATRLVSLAEPDDIALVLHTSGTTSRPKIVPLTQANICCSAHNVALTLDLSQADICLNVMPLFHIHGLIAGVMASLNAGASVICSQGFDASKFFGWIDECSPTWYTAVPTIHQAVLARAQSHKDVISRRPLRLIRSSSAALPPKVMEELEAAFGTQVVEAYGMTEASHQMTSNPLAPKPRKPGSVGIPGGPDVAIMDEPGNLLNVGQTGEVVISGPNVTAGYENNESANKSSFVREWFRTGDQGYFDPDGYLFLTGRLKEIINRGGEKIAPREIDDVLTQHPSVAQAVTFAVPHPTLGEEVAAAVVLKQGATASEGEIRQLCHARLAEFKVPKQLLIVDEIPKGSTGKLQRIGLADKLADKLAQNRQASYASATNAVEEQVVEIWKKVLSASDVGVRSNFYTLGGDSLAVTTMLLEVEERFKVSVPIDTFLANPTIETIANTIDPNGSAPVQKASEGSQVRVRDSWLGGLKNRLFQYLALYMPGYKSTRVWLHRMRGVAIGENVSIGLSALIETAYPRLVFIGNNVSIGMRSVIIGHLRDATDSARTGDRHTVRIEDDVYIGPGVIVLPNVTIGKGAVVSAGSVVSRSVPPHTLVQGNPARPVAKCGVSLGGGVSYEQFLRHLTPIKD